ncbi:MAG: alpha/beta hydrolase [Oscillospiraceae bacterium]
MARLQITTGVPDITLDAVVPEYTRALEERGISEEQFLADRELPVLWLLHGASGHSSDWLRYTQAELFAEEKGIVVVCPSARSGFYLNQYQGIQWGEIITRKLWALVHGMLPTSDDPEKNYIAGNSMGGYGAMLLGLTHPECFSRIGCFSGGVEMPQKYAAGGEPMEEIWGLADSFGPKDKVLGGANDLYALAKRRAAGGELPEIYMCCGTRDEHERDISPRFRDYLRGMGYQVTWSDGDFGHEWRYWNIELEKFLHWLP